MSPSTRPKSIDFAPPGGTARSLAELRARLPKLAGMRSPVDAERVWSHAAPRLGRREPPRPLSGQPSTGQRGAYCADRYRMRWRAGPPGGRLRIRPGSATSLVEAADPGDDAMARQRLADRSMAIGCTAPFQSTPLAGSPAGRYHIIAPIGVRRVGRESSCIARLGGIVGNFTASGRWRSSIGRAPVL